ncbi:MAG: hypothetical protein FWC27_11985, partial [Firmicutes bacterium]|nr:hypothetical protein [Bacillota bacterium]
MVAGYESFKDWFQGYEDQFVVIGGAACDIMMSEVGAGFRGTKDIDMVLLVESLTADFGRRFWAYVTAGGYQHKNKSNGQPQFYRFTNPGRPGFPLMIELFSRRADAIELPADAVLTPLPLDDDLSSLSAILMDDDYYSFLQAGRTVIDGIPILDAAHLIPLKAKAWLDWSDRKAAGEAVDSRHIRKHKNDVFRLSGVLLPSAKAEASAAIIADLTAFCAAMRNEDVD